MAPAAPRGPPSYAAAMSDLPLQQVTANGVDFSYFEAGSGPLALCLHGYPDTAHTFRHLLPALADAGFHAVAPFNRGYAPTALADDGRYQSGVLGVDANALHDALGGGADSVIIGHDWGAQGAYAAATLSPSNWRRVVAAAVPPGPVMAEAFFQFEQLRMSWYMFFQLNPLSDMVVPTNGFEFIAKLWRDWSPGYDSAADVAHFVDAMPTGAHVTAALAYYRQTLQFDLQAVELAAAQGATLALPPQPLCYLHGADDGCLSPSIAAKTAEIESVPGSAFHMVGHAGHFLHLERPVYVNRLITDFLHA